MLHFVHAAVQCDVGGVIVGAARVGDDPDVIPSRRRTARDLTASEKFNRKLDRIGHKALKECLP
jgi:hypothetical protein